MNDLPAMITVVILVTSTYTGAVMWIIKAYIKPLKPVIENNTQAMTTICATLNKHSEKISEHDVKIAEIETMHDVLGCKRKGGARR